LADFVTNISLGRAAVYHDNVKNGTPVGSRLVVMLLKTVASDNSIADSATFAAILAAGNVECDFTNYARKILAPADIALVVVTNAGTAGSAAAAFPPQTYTTAGGTTNNTILKLVVGYDPLGTNVNANIIPMTANDVVNPFGGSATTNGSDVQISVSTGSYLFIT
jgi:hypothetical protein